MAPAYSRSMFAISLLTGVKDAALQGDEVVGRYTDEERELRSESFSKTIVEQFVNWGDDPESILRFVQRYGPLSKWHRGEFRQSLQQWRQRQGELRAFWRQGPALGYKIGMREGEVLKIGRKELVLRVDDLSRFLEFEIFSHPAVRRRVCERPDCPNPYFIAAHLKTTLCSEVCKAWKQRQHQLNWWEEHGKEWRKRRVRAKKGMKGKKGRWRGAKRGS